MKLLLSLFLTFTFINSYSQGDNYKIENVQERLATYIVNEIQNNNIDSILKYIEPTYLAKKKAIIKPLLTKFYNEYKILAPGTKRYTTLVWPTGFNLFRFRYIDSTGTALQIDLSFKDKDINSKVLLLETVDRLTLKKQRDASNRPPKIIFADEKPKVAYPRTTIYILQNCNNENRTMTFSSQVDAFKNWVYGRDNFETNKVVKFAPEYRLDSSFIKKNIAYVKNTLPKNFWNFSVWGKTFNNTPNQDSIWFMHLYVQIDKMQNVKIFAAYKIVFDGTDAAIDRQRTNPKITNVEFILDKATLAELEKKLKSAKVAE